MTPAEILARMDQYMADHSPEVALMMQIRDTLRLVLHNQERRIYFPIGNEEGQRCYVNLAQAETINIVSDEQAEIRFSGRVVTIFTRNGVDALFQSIAKYLIQIEDPLKAPRQNTLASEQSG